ncbi:hypothetical protein SFR_3942 [Streptomyces sp. FR-008]|nr:hypothetical protein SFR_3942 [Streptomyces sp. FR-008]
MSSNAGRAESLGLRPRLALGRRTGLSVLKRRTG